MAKKKKQLMAVPFEAKYQFSDESPWTSDMAFPYTKGMSTGEMVLASMKEMYKALYGKHDSSYPFEYFLFDEGPDFLKKDSYECLGGWWIISKEDLKLATKIALKIDQRVHGFCSMDILEQSFIDYFAESTRKWDKKVPAAVRKIVDEEKAKKKAKKEAEKAKHLAKLQAAKEKAEKQCEWHPQYKGKKEPKRDCAKCWRIFLKNNPDYQATAETMIALLEAVTDY